MTLIMEAFETAKRAFLSTLGPGDAAALEALSTSEDVLFEVRKAEQEHGIKSATRRYMKKIESFVKGVEQYGKAIDVFANAKPEVLSLIWGTARLILHVCETLSWILDGIS